MTLCASTPQQLSCALGNTTSLQPTPQGRHAQHAHDEQASVAFAVITGDAERHEISAQHQLASNSGDSDSTRLKDEDTGPTRSATIDTRRDAAQSNWSSSSSSTSANARNFEGELQAALDDLPDSSDWGSDHGGEQDGDEERTMHEPTQAMALNFGEIFITRRFTCDEEGDNLISMSEHERLAQQLCPGAVEFRTTATSWSSTGCPSLPPSRTSTVPFVENEGGRQSITEPLSITPPTATPKGYSLP